MNTVERIKAICSERKIPLRRLEMECGFANGYIGQLKKGTLPHDRLYKIANYLDVTPEYLSTGEVKEGYYLNEETAKVAQEMFENKELRVLFDAARDASPEDLKLVYDMLMALKRKENNQ